MKLCLQLPFSYPSFSCSARKKKRQLRIQIYQNPKTKLHFPKSAPTPLLIHQNIIPRSKIQALETVIEKLEASVKTGILIEDPQIFASLLETCAQLKAIDLGIKVHNLIPLKLLGKNVGISSKLIRLYASNGYVEKAHEMFDQMSGRNSSSFPWNSLISGYVEMGLYEDALALYFQMVEEDMEPDEYTFPRVLKACGGIGMIQVGEEIHRHVIRFGLANDTFVLNSLVDMYAKCGDIVKARNVFYRINHKDLISWNTMIIGYFKHNLETEAFEIFRWMISRSCEPDSVTMSSVLSSISPYMIGAQVHGWIIRRGMEWNLSVRNSLILFYSNQDKLNQARWLFECMPERDTVSWNSIISAHSKDPQALEYFKRMMESGEASPDSITFVSLLSACAHLGLVKDGEELFVLMTEGISLSPSMEHYGCMVNLYGKAGLIDEAYKFISSKMEFEAGPTVWGALLYACYVHGNINIGEIAAKHMFELEPDGEHNFELLMKIYRNVGRYEDMDRIKVAMMERGLDL
ncbi:LOW QUALITY PROTEIN: pentatricopeptide repeat-containing protein At4g25270, chloroplastic-like [Primulina eburnea]|uniref:LOW QUALITY PROTEIN: pentatricopeptide repeat-containing protein At4g25270, chloroplastic-like n=1 Tax=Primulina eburnea TaxID=1245227 RepID=UPI003C6C2E5A